MNDADITFYRTRLLQEERLAASCNPQVAYAHRQMAEGYRERLRGIERPDGRSVMGLS